MVRTSEGETGTVTAGGSDGEGDDASVSTPSSGTEASSSTALTCFRKRGRLRPWTGECLKEAAERVKLVEEGREKERLGTGDEFGNGRWRAGKVEIEAIFLDGLIVFCVCEFWDSYPLLIRYTHSPLQFFFLFLSLFIYLNNLWFFFSLLNVTK